MKIKKVETHEDNSKTKCNWSLKEEVHMKDKILEKLESKRQSQKIGWFNFVNQMFRYSSGRSNQIRKLNLVCFR
jgi:hypothetical protein